MHFIELLFSRCLVNNVEQAVGLGTLVVEQPEE